MATLFLRLGFTAFGGPAAHVGMMHEEVVKRRKWLSEQEYLDLLGATNLIPGPNSTEMAIHIGLRRAGWPGFVLAGLGFILPAVLMVLALAWAYVRFGTRPEAGWLLVWHQAGSHRHHRPGTVATGPHCPQDPAAGTAGRRRGGPLRPRA